MREAAAGYLPYVDGLRAMAVLSVLVYHLEPSWLPGGFAGVDIFFVISGFVVSASVDRLGSTSPLETALAFYARRVRRIAPALLACLLLTGVGSALLIPDAWLSGTSLDTGQWAFVGLSNWMLAATAGDYYSPRAEYNPYVHTWSLGVEEQFYLAFPWLFAAWLSGTRPWHSVGLFAFGFLASLAYGAHLAFAGGAEATAFYVTTTRFWELAAGVLLYQGIRLGAVSPGAARRSGPNGTALRSVGIGVCALALAAGIVLVRPGRTPWPDSLVPALGTVGVLGLVYASARDGWVARALSLGPVVAVGKVSYSLYLWHWPVFVLFRWTSGLDAAGTRVAALVIASSLAVLSYRFVERPLRHAPALVRMRERRLLGAAALVILGLALAHRGTALASGAFSLSVVTRNSADWYSYGGARDASVPDCEIGARGEGAIRRYTRVGCAPPDSEARRVFVAGDSHAAAYAEMLRRLTLETGGELSIFTITECPPPSEGAPLDCETAVERAYAASAGDARAGDVLFLPRLRLPRLGEQWSGFGDGPSAAPTAEASGPDWPRWEAAAFAALEPLSSRGVHIVFEAPKPLFRAPAFRCSDWFNRDNPVCAPGLSVQRAFLEEYRRPALESVRRLAARLPGATVWDPFPLLCPNAVCEAAPGGRPLFFDGDHVSGYANRLLLPSFRAHLEGLTAPSA
jgi:peptidoglycan/LPS O-acetylase OafA/YrhL